MQEEERKPREQLEHSVEQLQGSLTSLRGELKGLKDQERDRVNALLAYLSTLSGDLATLGPGNCILYLIG